MLHRRDSRGRTCPMLTPTLNSRTPRPTASAIRTKKRYAAIDMPPVKRYVHVREQTEGIIAQRNHFGERRTPRLQHDGDHLLLRGARVRNRVLQLGANLVAR